MEKTFSPILLLLIIVSSVNVLHAQGIFGKWKTIDDRTGNPKGIIEIYEEGGKIHGKILSILEKGKENATCKKCKGEKKDKPIVGMKIIEDLKDLKNGFYKGKTLFDPEQAMTFRCRIWLNPKDHNELKVRGYLAFIYRTQTWLRVGE